MACSAITFPAALTLALNGLDTKYVSMIGSAEFMCDVRTFLIEDTLIGVYREHVASQLAKALLFMSTTIITTWVMYQGYMIISGANKQPVLPMMLKTGKMVLVMSLVSLLAGQSPVIADTVDNFRTLISTAIVGSSIDIYQMVDLNLAIAMVFNMLVDGLVGGQLAGADGNSLTKMAALIGQSGPAVLVSVLSMMAEISLVLAIMLSPLFLMFFLFQQTTSMFWSWVKFLLGTLVSLAVITLLGTIMMDMMMQYAGKVVAAFFLNAAINALGSGVGVSGGYDISASAMQLGALGALATALLTMVPPLIMGFFNSGAAFAGSALMAMGGGGAGVAGVAQAMARSASGGAEGGATGATGGATGAPALGSSGGSSASDNYAASNNQALLARANGNAGLPAPSNGMALGSGARGNANVELLRSQQSGDDFRAGSNMKQSAGAGGSGPGISTPGSGGGSDGSSWTPKYSNGTDVADATFREHPHLGTGGALNVASGSGGGGAVGGSKTIEQSAPMVEALRAPGAAVSTTGSEGAATGSSGSGGGSSRSSDGASGGTSEPVVTASSRFSETPVHRGPGGQYGAAAAIQAPSYRPQPQAPTQTG